MSAAPPYGAQPERTQLSWRRTTLAAMVAWALALRHQLLVGSGTWGWLAVAGAGAGSFALLALAHTRMRQLRPARPRPIGGRLVLAAGLSVWVLAFTGFAFLLFEA